MPSFFNRKRGGRVFDVLTSSRTRQQRFWFFQRKSQVIDLKPIYRQYQAWAVLGLVLLVIVFGFVFRKIFTRAEVADFYPTTCLGTWQNPEKAQEEPENFILATSSFTSENSAVFTTYDQRIFCGQFIPDEFEARGNIKNVGLTLIWDIRGLEDLEIEAVEVIHETEPQFEPDDDSRETTPSLESETQPSEEQSAGNEASPPDSEPEEEILSPSTPETATGSEATSTESLPLNSREPAITTSSEPENTPSFNSDSNREPRAFLRFLPLSLALAQTTTTDESGILNSTSAEVTADEITAGEPASAEATAGEPETGSNEDTTSTILGPPIFVPLEPIVEQEADDTEQEAGNIEQESTGSIEPEILPPPPPDEDFLRISYSLDGQDWFELAEINPQNWQNFTITLPISSWDELRKLQISVEGILTTTGERPRVLLDGMLLEIHYDLPPVFGIEEDKKEDLTDAPIAPEDLPIVELSPEIRPVPVDQENGDFGSGQAPRFDFDLESLPLPELSPPSPEARLPIQEGDSRRELGRDRGDQEHRRFSFRSFLYFLGLAQAKSLKVGGSILNIQNPIAAQIIDPENKPTDIKPLLLTVNNKLRISVPEPKIGFQPGRYKLKLWILKNDVVYFSETSFTWGVLAMNFNKSIYSLGDEAKIGLGVLDDRGHTICDARLDMKIFDPTGVYYIFSTEDGSIARSESCGPETVTDEPDYATVFMPAEIGVYEVAVRAETRNGIRGLSDKFEAQTKPTFDIERLGPTRIYPPATYKMTIRVKANQEFTGEAIELVPASFDLITEKRAALTEEDGLKKIAWLLDLKDGESEELVYFFDAPDVSPELYKLGPLALYQGTLIDTNTRLSDTNSFSGTSSNIGGPFVFREARRWLLAADAAGEIILMWEGDVIPDGWDCISCDAGDPFIDVFPRASSTYATASSSDHTSTHDLTYSSQLFGGGGEMVAFDSSPAVYPGDHTHTWGTSTLSTDDIRPLYRGLQFIRAATTTLPNGVIGIFDVASSSLPSDWTYYSALEDRYLAGTSTVGNSGAATHNHTTDNAIVSGAAASTWDDTGSGVTVGGTNHTHTIATSTAINSDNNQPLYIGVVFGQTTATTTLGSGSDGLMAMFDNVSLPTDWVIVSTSGSAYAGNLLIGTSTPGSTGGSEEHSHSASTALASDGPSETRVVATGLAEILNDSTHTHSVTYTVSSASSLPIYRDVILGKYTVPVVLAVSNVVLNPSGGASSSIILTANATTTILAVASATGDPTSATGTIYRSSVSGGADCSADDLNCYQISSCTIKDSNTSIECSADIWYFADATDASSSYPSDDWMAQITASNGTDTDTSSTISGDSAVELNTLVAIDVTTSTIDYGTLAASSTTGTANQITTVKNVGNSSSSLDLSATALIKGTDEIATSSQHYATSTFIFNSGDTAISETATAVAGTTMRPRTNSATNDVGSWSATEALLGNQYEGSSVVSNRYVYAIGGNTSTVSFAQINSTGTLNAWAETTALPASYKEHSAVSSGGYIYITGGRAPTETSTVLYGSVNANGSISEWLTTTALPISTYDHSSVVSRGYVYVIGGRTGSGNTSTVLYASINSNSTLGSWLETTALPLFRYAHAAVTDHENIYITGGIPDPATSGTTSSVLYASINSNGTLGSWLDTTASPSGIQDHYAAAYNENIYIVGGDKSIGFGTTTVSYAPINSDGTLGSWADSTALPATVKWQSGAVYNGYLYAIGGYKGGALTTDVDYAFITNGQSYKDIFWGLEVTGGHPTGTYIGTSTFDAVFEE